MIDFVVRGDKVVTPAGVGAFDIGISGERIVSVAERGAAPIPEGARLIDATGKIVIPGGIDPHVHCAWPMPDPDGGPARLTEPPAVVSRAALFGGTTTLIDFARACMADSVRDAVEQRQRDWTSACYCDYALHLMVEGDLRPDLPAELAEAVQAGYATVKIFTTDITPNRRGRMVAFGDIWEVFKTLSREGGLAVIHAEDNDIVMHMYGKLIREGRTAFEHMAEVHNSLSEDLSFNRVIRLAENVPGMALYMMHVSAATGVEAIRASRRRGFPIYGETLHQYLMYSSDDYRRPNGQIYHTYPSLKTPADQAALWDGMLEGTISTVATDELCCSLAVKTQGKRIDDVTGGNSAVEPRLSVMYTEMVTRRGYSLERFVDLVSSNAARIMGLYPRKGALVAGADADIVVLDPGLARTLRAEDLHETDYTPWEGHQVTAWPSLTMLRGKVVVEGDRFFGALADGRWLPRRIAPEIFAGSRA